MSAGDPAGNSRQFVIERDDVNAAFGQVLREIRLASGLSTRELSGVSSGYVSRIETGKAIPSWAVLRLYLSRTDQPARLVALWEQVRAAELGERRDRRTR